MVIFIFFILDEYLLANQAHNQDIQALAKAEEV